VFAKHLTSEDEDAFLAIIHMLTLLTFLCSLKNSVLEIEYFNIPDQGDPHYYNIYIKLYQFAKLK
jgi:hypothetical protein